MAKLRTGRGQAVHRRRDGQTGHIYTIKNRLGRVRHYGDGDGDGDGGNKSNNDNHVLVLERHKAYSVILHGTGMCLYGGRMAGTGSR